MSAPRRPLALVVSGPPASGKSTLARSVARALGACLLDLDTATGPLVQVLSTRVGVSDLDDPHLADLTREARYETVTHLAADNLDAWLSVVLVAPYSLERRDPRRWARLHDELAGHGAAARLVWIGIDRATLRARLATRNAERDSPKLARDDWVDGIDLAPPAAEHLRLDGTLHPEQLTRTLLDALVGERLLGPGALRP